MIQKKTHNLYSVKYNQNNYTICFGEFGIKSNSFGKLTKIQLDSLERLLINFLKKITNNKKKIKIWNLIFFNLTLTKLSSESRMGKGKGAVYTKAFFLKPGTIIFEFNGLSKQHELEIFQFMKNKLPFKISLIRRF
uniref:Ribosomal protein L16 n=1 Tax=Riquetophycus sp. HSY-2014a TaxID=1488470 RepID=A0A0E3DBS4_9FLOR|nr:ribosomal protein L16 [Riquetophycus sp. HSY-2014a]